MVSPSYECRVCAMFDFFCKKTSYNYYRDLLRVEKCRNRNHQEEPVDYLLELLGHKDIYPSDSFVLYVDGHSCVVESENLYKALISLWKSRGRFCCSESGEIIPTGKSQRDWR